MLGAKILLIVSLAVSFSSALYNEKFRPQLHYSPPSGWMNDPNSLIYYQGVFHLFYQHNPVEPTFGPISWGHAVSVDLVHWKTLDIAISPEQGNAIYSGNAIIDHDNVTGLQVYDNTKTFIAIFTAHDINTQEEKQWLAFSNDGPKYEQFKFYKNNPIIPTLGPGKPADFRDPTIFKHGDHFVAILVAFNHTMIYNSHNLLEWTLVSEFGEYDGSHLGVWECPALVPLSVTIDGVEVEKYVLIISLASTMQYFIGSFDGRTFTNDNSKETELWVDYGPDSYAGNVYNQLPDGRRVLISWMNRWDYAPNLNFSVWNGQMGFPRELKLNKVGDRVLLSSLPIHEVEMLRSKHVRKQNVPIAKDFIFEIAENEGKEGKHTVDIEMALDLTNLRSNDTFDLVFFDKNDSIKISVKENEFILDRSNAGRTDFPNFGLVWKAPRFIRNHELKLRIVIDRSSIEFFADDGLTVFTSLFYSDEDIASKMAINVHSSKKDSKLHLKELNVYQMESIWN